MMQMLRKPFHFLSILAFLLAWMPGANASAAAGIMPQAPGVDTTWQQILPTKSPTARYVHGMAYDASRAVLVLFGGDGTGKQRLNDTWEFNGVNWTQVQPPVSPPGRVNIFQAMVYDSSRHKIVLFGGLSRTGYMNDTWEYDGSNWTMVNTLHYPPGRDAHAMVYDSARHVTVLFGGYDPANPYLNDTWEYDGTDWRQVSTPQTPPGRHHFGMAYDSQRHVVVLFGGHSASSPQMNDTWEYNGLTWQQVSPSLSPSARESHSMTYDNQRGVVVLFGGTNNGSVPLDDTWEYDGTSWSHILPTVSPSARLGFPLVYDSSRGKVMLFGGGYWTSRLNVNKETWEFGLDSGASNGIVLEARNDIGMPYDIYRGCASAYIGCGGAYHGFNAGVSTDVVLDAYKFGADFNIKRELDQDALLNPGRYQFTSPRYAEDLHRYYNLNQLALSHQQPYLPGDIAFFDWNGDGLTDHVSVVTLIDLSGRPLAMVDAMGFTSSNPGGMALETNWSNYYEQHVQNHARLGPPLVTTPISPTATVQMLRIRLNSPGASLRLHNGQGKVVSREYDENLVASNIQAFIPYIPESGYAELSTNTVISVTNPLANASDYFVDLSSQEAVTYTLSIQTLQNGSVTDEVNYTNESLPAGGSQRLGFTVAVHNGSIQIDSPFTNPAPSLSLPAEITFFSPLGVTAQHTFAITETTGAYPLQNALLTPTDLIDQMGGMIPSARIHLTPDHFSLPAGSHQAVLLEVNLSGIAPGLYQGNLGLTSGNASPIILRVSLLVEPPTLFLPFLKR